MSRGTNPYSRRQREDEIEDSARGSLRSELTDNSQSDSRLKPIPFKVCFIGNSSVGKTCIVERYVNNKFSAQANTLSAAFTAKTITVDPSGCQPTKVKLQIWDTAGSEEYRAINSLYYKKAAVVCLVYSVNDYESFDGLSSYWSQQLEQNAEQNCIKFVVAAKIDDDNIEDDGEVVPKSVGAEYAQRINAHFFMTSAKENIGINKMFQKAAELCAQHEELRNDIDRTAPVVPNNSAEPDFKDQTNRSVSIRLTRGGVKASEISHQSGYESFVDTGKKKKKGKGCC